MKSLLLQEPFGTSDVLVLLTLMYLFEIAQTELQAVLKTRAHWGMIKLQNNVFHFVASSFPICP